MVRLKSKNRNKNEEIKKSLKFSVVDGSAHSVMEGFGKSYIAPFAIALKASNTMVGVISSLPDLIGSLAQLGSTRLVEHFKSRKKIIVFCALIQALLWLPLFFVPLLFSNYGPMIVLLFVTLQAVVSYTINPLWNSMMGDLVPENERGKYFGRRNMITGAFVFVSTFVAGFLLNHFSKTHPFYGFGILFCAAFSARLVSALYLSRMYDQEYIV
ncbi:MAG: MFS transporter, partial [Nanoarchaeota archaeon]|nr:MFS transporter [Nanoarchaeota archaeon]